MSSHALFKVFRRIHLYIGVFIAPALLFFAFTGALQTFSLHESTPGSSYKPPAWAVTLAQIHKKQTMVVPVRKLPRPGAPSADHAPAGMPGHDRLPAHHPLPLKIFFLLVAIGLFTSTVTGIIMSWKYVRNRVVIAALLLAGILIPVVLVLI